MSAQTDLLREKITNIESQLNRQADQEVRDLLSKGKRELDQLDNADSFSDPGALPNRTRVGNFLTQLQAAVQTRNAAVAVTGQTAAQILAEYDALP